NNSRRPALHPSDTPATKSNSRQSTSKTQPASQDPASPWKSARPLAVSLAPQPVTSPPCAATAVHFGLLSYSAAMFVGIAVAAAAAYSTAGNPACSTAARAH